MYRSAPLCPYSLLLISHEFWMRWEGGELEEGRGRVGGGEKRVDFLKKSKKVSKMQNFTLILNPFKKLLKNAPKKSYKQNKLDEHE
jgi:hypothetical protein